MVDSYVLHIYRYAHHGPQYIIGHIVFARTGHKQFVSDYAGLLHALSDTVTGSANEAVMVGQGKRWAWAAQL